MYIKLISLIIAVMCLMKIFKFNKSVKKFFVVNVFIIISYHFMSYVEKSYYLI